MERIKKSKSYLPRYFITARVGTGGADQALQGLAVKRRPKGAPSPQVRRQKA